MPTLNFPNGLTREVTVVSVETLATPTRTISQPQRRPIVLRMWSYARAVAHWKAAGSPLRTQEQIEAALAICQTCEHYTAAKRPHCKICGCLLNSAPHGLANKIAMATEHCPLDPPKW